MLNDRGIVQEVGGEGKNICAHFERRLSRKNQAPFVPGWDEGGLVFYCQDHLV